MSVHFQFLEPTTLANRSALKSFIQRSVKKEGFILDQLTIIFCSDNYLLNINKLYLNHNYFTDIISFDLSEKRGIINGELYISIHRVKENASNFKTSIKDELHRVIFHGALHLLGYNDKTPKEISKIRLMEDKWLLSYFKSI